MDEQATQARGFDAEVAKEWATFEVALGDHLAQLSRTDRYEVYSLDQHDEPLIVVTREDELSKFELIAPALSSYDLGQEQRRVTKALGITTHPATFEWRLVHNGKLHLADHISWVMVQLLRDVYNVSSPVVLDAGTLTIPAPDEPQALFDTRKPIAADGTSELAVAVDRTLAEIAPQLDRINDNYFRLGESEGAITVRVDGDRGAVWVLQTPVRTRNTSLATREVALLNRDAVYGRYYLNGGWLIAEARLSADPFLPQHLIDTITALYAETQRIAGDFAWRTHGTVLDV